VCIRDVLVPVGSLDPLSFVNGSFTLLSSPLVTRDRPTVVGFIELRDVALQPGTLVELSCDAESPTPEKCDVTACTVCNHRWRLHVFEGETAGLFMLFNRSMPWKKKFKLSQVMRHASFRRPVVSVDGIANAQCASGEPPEGAGKTLILDPRFPEHVVRPLHVLESSGLMEEPEAELDLFDEVNVGITDDDRRRLVGDGMARRFVDPVARRTVARIKQYKFACAVRRAHRAVIPLQSRLRRMMVEPRPPVTATRRSTVGSGTDLTSAESGPGFLGGIIRLQAVVRQALASRSARRREFSRLYLQAVVQRAHASKGTHQRKFGKAYSSDSDGDGPVDPKDRKLSELGKYAKPMRATDHEHE
jgi:hypothetical protein